MDSVRIVGTEQLISLHSRLRKADETRIAALMTRRIRRAAEPLRDDLKNTIRTLPIRSEPRKPGKRGGPTATTRPLRATVAEAVRISVRTTRPVGARVWVDRWSLPSDLQKMPAVMNSANGRIRHPVFGNKRHWANQWTTPLWWEKTVRAHTPRMQAEVARVLDDVRRTIT
ncbi:hypothetical protein ACFWV1_12835 [Streptomyces sp. NPDC058700]|uniref:hypothetical protein n=1 Tax=Streptomyces sp. NPDC058700 TaxID=3346607 RepID=UPI003665836C